MISGNSHWKCKPFILKPVGKDYLWGGTRLNDDFSKNLPQNPLAESWECSTHPQGESIVATGAFTGRTLRQVLIDHPEFLGSNHKGQQELPILVKLIDANKDLSVQVHPDDAYAAEHENGALGKTEMWYVLDAEPGAQLVYGLKHSISSEELKKSAMDGTIVRHMHTVNVKPGDIFFIEPGTIHAIGHGILIAEIQESSNLTYRLYDYDRVDKNGNRRELHLHKAAEVANLQGISAPRQPMRVLKYRPGCAQEHLCRCKYFEVSRMLLNTERIRGFVGYSADENAYRVMLCTDGCGSIVMEDGENLPFFRGDCLFVPAGAEKIRFHGKAEFLDIRG